MTTTAKRPSAARKHTRKTEEHGDAELDRGLAVTDTDGTRLQVRIRDVRGSHDAALVRETGFDFMGLLEQMTRRQGLDLFAATLWFARLVNGRDAGSYMETLDAFGYEDFAALDIDEPAAEADAPKASGSNS